MVLVVVDFVVVDCQEVTVVVGVETVCRVVVHLVPPPVSLLVAVRVDSEVVVVDVGVVYVAVDVHLIEHSGIAAVRAVSPYLLIFLQVRFFNETAGRTGEAKLITHIRL